MIRRRVLLVAGMVVVLLAAGVSGWLYLGSGTRPVARTGHRVRQSAARSPSAPAGQPLPVAAPALAPLAPPTPALQFLQAELATVLAGQGCAVVGDGALRLADVQGDVPLAPASTEKLLVATAALAALGPGYRFQTTVVASTPPHEGAVSALWLVGAGDPVLATTDYVAYWTKDRRYAGQPTTPFEALADQLVTAGVRSVPGGIHGDDSRFSPVRLLPQWAPTDVANGDASPLSALDVNQGWQAWASGYVPVADPPAGAAGQLGGLLATRGVSVPPVPATDGPAPRGTILASVQSPPLAQIVSAMLRSSDNHTAEMLTLELGRRVEGDGSTAAGLRAVTDVDERLGIPTAGLSMVDGSGLAHQDRVTCQALLVAIDLGTKRPDLAALAEGLAVAGRTGTLVNQWVGTPLQDHLLGKTGSINGVVALAGVLELGHPLHFAVILNGSGGLEETEQRLVTVLADFSGA